MDQAAGSPSAEDSGCCSPFQDRIQGDPVNIAPACDADLDIVISARSETDLEFYWTERDFAPNALARIWRDFPGPFMFMYVDIESSNATANTGGSMGEASRSNVTGPRRHHFFLISLVIIVIEQTSLRGFSIVNA